MDIIEDAKSISQDVKEEKDDTEYEQFLCKTDVLKINNSDVKLETELDNKNNLPADFRMNIIDAVKSISQNMGKEKVNNVDYEEFLCKNEEVELKIERDEETEVEW